MATQCDIAVRFHPPPEDLAGYFTTFYRVEITVASGERVVDALQPEWGNLRFFSGDLPHSRIGEGPAVSDSDFVVTGPSSQPLNFALGTTRLWGVGLFPAGWCEFVGTPAAEMANKVLDGRKEPAFSAYRALADDLTCAPEDEAADLARLVGFFREEAARHHAPYARIKAIHAALIEDGLPDVATMAERAQISQRTLERLARNAFGFPPKLLLRRQRFMRSLANFLLSPDARWSEAMDTLYYDQSHFVRDCHAFLGMAPSEYAALDHPVMTGFVRERARLYGSPVQTLDPPGRE